MIMTNKPTIMDQINAISFEGLTEEQYNFLVERAKMSVRKASAKTGPSKAQKENLALAEKVRDFIVEKGAVTVKEVEDFLEVSNQKATAVLQVVEGLHKIPAKGKQKVRYTFEEVESEAE